MLWYHRQTGRVGGRRSPLGSLTVFGNKVSTEEQDQQFQSNPRMLQYCQRHFRESTNRKERNETKMQHNFILLCVVNNFKSTQHLLQFFFKTSSETMRLTLNIWCYLGQSIVFLNSGMTDLETDKKIFHILAEIDILMDGIVNCGVFFWSWLKALGWVPIKVTQFTSFGTKIKMI